jgi:hypothetical protein
MTMAHTLTERMARLLAKAVFNEGRLGVPARSHYRRAADALDRRGLLSFHHSNGFLAFYDITDDGRAEHERRTAK